MRKKIIIEFILLIGVMSILSVSAQDRPNYSETIAKSREVIARSMEKEKFPGLSIAVGLNGNIIWSEAFGFSDLENDVHATTATRFRIASVSKLITAAGMARLYEQGKLDIDAPVQKYVPGFPRKQANITTRQLVGHLSGIRHYKRDIDPAKDEFFSRTKNYRTVTDCLTFFQNDPLDFLPGEKFGYSSYGYTLLSAVIENVSGQDFLTYTKKEILTPLGMTSTTADKNEAIIPNRTRFYSLDKDRSVINAAYIDGSSGWAAGSFLSTPEDLVRFGSAHLKAGFLKEKTLKEMFTSQKTNDGKPTGTGFGWRIGKDPDGRTIYFHPGENVGGRSYLVVYPESGLVIAVVHNLTGGSLAVATQVSRSFAAAIH